MNNIKVFFFKAEVKYSRKKNSLFRFGQCHQFGAYLFAYFFCSWQFGKNPCIVCTAKFGLANWASFSAHVPVNIFMLQLVKGSVLMNVKASDPIIEVKKNQSLKRNCTLHVDLCFFIFIPNLHQLFLFEMKNSKRAFYMLAEARSYSAPGS